MGHTGRLPNADLEKVMKGVHGFSASFKVSTEMEFDLHISGDSHEEIVACKNAMTTLITLLGVVKKGNRIPAQIGELLAAAPTPKKAIAGKRPVVANFRTRYNRRDLTRWLAVSSINTALPGRPSCLEPRSFRQ